MVAKITDRKLPLETIAAETLADLLYEIGKDLHTKSNFDRASRWLENAYQVIVSHEIETLSADSTELKLSIMHLLGFTGSPPFLIPLLD